MNFEVDDRVLCIKAFGGNDDIVNKKGTIIKKCDDRYAVEFDKEIRNGHRSIHFILGITDPGKDGHCWNFWSSDEGPIIDYLKKINNTKRNY